MRSSVGSGVTATGYLGYLGDVAAAVSGLPESDRDELLETVVDHLDSIAAESGEPVDRQALVARLGPPRSYATELAAAAGFAVPAVPAVRPQLPSALATVRGWPATRATAAYLARLVPAWWAVRGFLISGVFLAVCVPLSGDSYLTGYSYDKLDLLRHWRPDAGALYGRSTAWVLLPVLALVTASVALGQRAEIRAGSAFWWNRALDVAAVLALVLVPSWWLSPMFYGYVVSS